jgi:hypothetical protein
VCCLWMSVLSNVEAGHLLYNFPCAHPTLFAMQKVLPIYRCREIMRNSPTALRVLKAALNAAEDGQAGIQASRVLL